MTKSLRRRQHHGHGNQSIAHGLLCIVFAISALLLTGAAFSNISTTEDEFAKTPPLLAATPAEKALPEILATATK